MANAKSEIKSYEFHETKFEQDTQNASVFHSNCRTGEVTLLAS